MGDQAGPIKFDSWKEIADYLKRTEKTCRRWENKLGLPVHRLESSPRARVFAYKHELDQWIEKTGSLRDSPEDHVTLADRLPSRLDVQKYALLSLAVLGVALAVLIVRIVVPRKDRAPASILENSVAVISFENQTGDISSDWLQNAIPDLLIRRLEQQGGFYVMSSERLRDLLKQIGKSRLEYVDRGVGFELCRREGVETIVWGRIAKAGDTYLTDMDVVDVRSRRLLRSSRVQGEGLDSILNTQIDLLSGELLSAIGMATKNRIDARFHVSEVTTTSMAAYRNYRDGLAAYEKGRLEEAKRLFEKAVDIDPSYMEAYQELGAVHLQQRNYRDQKVAWERAKELLNKSLDKERLFFQADYAAHLEYDRDKAIEILRQLVRRYPREKRAYWLLANLFYWDGQFQESLTGYRRVLELDPANEIVFDEMGEVLIGLGEYDQAEDLYMRYLALHPGEAQPLGCMGRIAYKKGRLEEALAYYLESLEKEPGFYYSLNAIHQVLAFLGKFDEAMTWVDRYIERSPSVGIKADGYIWRAFYHHWLGQDEKARGDLDKARELAKVGDNSRMARRAEWVRGYFLNERGEVDSSRSIFEEWLGHEGKDFPTNRPLDRARYSIVMGLLEVKNGQTISARSRLDEIRALMPEVKAVRKDLLTYRMNCLAGEIGIAQQDFGRTISALKKTSFPEDPIFYMTELRMDHQLINHEEILARAYIGKGDLDKAISLYQRITRPQPDRRNRLLVRPLNVFRLAKLYDKKGSAVKAAEMYRKFLDLWRNADPGAPEIEQARGRLKALRIAEDKIG